MHISLDHRGRVPIYRQIVEQIRRLVEQGRLSPGERLPTIRDLAADLEINFNTVARAYRILHDAGLISTQQGRGTYVVGPGDDGVRSRRDALNAILEDALEEAAELGFTRPEVERAWREAMARSFPGE